MELGEHSEACLYGITSAQFVRSCSYAAVPKLFGVSSYLRPAEWRRGRRGEPLVDTRVHMPALPSLCSAAVSAIVATVSEMGRGRLGWDARGYES